MSFDALQRVTGGNISILGGHSIGHSKQDSIYAHVYYSERFPRCSCFTVQTSNTPCPHTSCKVHWCWRWNFRKFIILGKLYYWSCFFCGALSGEMTGVSYCIYRIYLHRDRASRRRRRKAKSQIWDSTIWSRVSRESDPRKTRLARASSI
jgi:hypothetical protein